MIYNLSPEGIRKVLVNIRKTQERMKKKRKEKEEEEKDEEEQEHFTARPEKLVFQTIATVCQQQTQIRLDSLSESFLYTFISIQV